MRSRTIKPDFYMDEDLSSCSIPARYLFHGLWGFADREGRFEWKVKRMKAEIFPYDNVKIEGLLAELVTGGFVVPYSSDGASYGEIPNFKKHQPIHPHEARSVIPERSDSVNVITSSDMSRSFPTEPTEPVGKGNSNSRGKGNSTERGPGETIPPLESARDSVCDEFGKACFDHYLPIVSDWLASSGKKYKDYSAFMRNWIRRERDEGKGFFRPGAKSNAKQTNLEKAREVLYGDSRGRAGTDGVSGGGVLDVSSDSGKGGDLDGRTPSVLPRTIKKGS